MRIIIKFFIFTFIIAGCSRDFHNGRSIIHKNGYLVSISNDEIIFFAANKPKQVPQLSDIPGDTGILVSGRHSPDYSKLFERARKMEVDIPTGNNANDLKDVRYMIEIIPVRVSYKIHKSTLPQAENLGVLIKFNGGNFTFNYSSNPNIAIHEVKSKVK